MRCQPVVVRADESDEIVGVAQAVDQIEDRHAGRADFLYRRVHVHAVDRHEHKRRRARSERRVDERALLIDVVRLLRHVVYGRSPHACGDAIGTAPRRMVSRVEPVLGEYGERVACHLRCLANGPV